jgi:hypothetical protein
MNKRQEEPGTIVEEPDEMCGKPPRGSAVATWVNAAAAGANNLTHRGSHHLFMYGTEYHS